MERSVIAPPPAFEDAASQKAVQAPQSAVIAPPPAVDDSRRRIGEMNIGRGAVIAPAPQLSVDEQRTMSSGRSAALRGHTAQVIAPPPSVGASGGSRSGRDMIALSLH